MVKEIYDSSYKKVTMNENGDIKDLFLPLAAGVVLSAVFLIIDSVFAASYLAFFGLLISAFAAGFMIKKPILYSIVCGAAIAVIVSLIVFAVAGGCPYWAELLGKGIVGALLGNVVRTKLLA